MITSAALAQGDGGCGSEWLAATGANRSRRRTADGVLSQGSSSPMCSRSPRHCCSAARSPTGSVPRRIACRPPRTRGGLARRGGCAVGGGAIGGPGPDRPGRGAGHAGHSGGAGRDGPDDRPPRSEQPARCRTDAEIRGMTRTIRVGAGVGSGLVVGPPGPTPAGLPVCALRHQATCHPCQSRGRGNHGDRSSPGHA